MVLPSAARSFPSPTRPASSSSRARSQRAASSSSPPAARRELLARRRHRGHARSRATRASRRSWTAASRRCIRRSTAACSARRGVDDARDGASTDRADRSAGRQSLSVRGDGRASRTARYDEAIENIDIGGPAMVRAAAKNHESVAVVVDPARLRAMLWTSSPRMAAARRSTLRSRLAAKAFAHTARYDTVVADYLRRAACRCDAQRFPERPAAGRSRRLQDLRYGENPHQRAAFYRGPAARGAGVATARMLQGKELSFNNIADADTAIECVRQFDAAGLRHRQARESVRRRAAAPLLEAYERAYRTDPDVRVRRHHRVQPRARRRDRAAILERQFVEVHRSRRRSMPDARSQCSRRKPNVRVLVLGDADAPTRSGARVPQRHRRPARADARSRHVRRSATCRSSRSARRRRRELADLLFAWRVVQVRQVERHRLRARRRDDRHRRGPDEPRRTRAASRR